MTSFRAMEVMVAVAEELSVSRAADRLHLSQPAVSHQLSSVEKEVGVALVDRGPRGVTLTAEGREFVEHARVALAAATRAMESGRLGSSSATLRLAVAESYTLPIVVPVATEWNAAGGPTLQLTETSSANVVLDGLRAGDQDLVLVPGPLHTPGLHTRIIGTEAVVVVAHADHPVLSTPVSLADLKGMALVGVEPAHGFGGWIANRFLGVGLVYRHSLQTRSVQSAAALAAAGFGVAVVPQSAVSPGTKFTTLEPPLRREILLVTRATPRGALSDLTAAILGHVQRLGFRSSKNRGSEA